MLPPLHLDLPSSGETQLSDVSKTPVQTTAGSASVTGAASGGGGGGGGGQKGASFAGATAPRRGRGVLNPSVGLGGRTPLCAHCNGHIRLKKTTNLSTTLRSLAKGVLSILEWSNHWRSQDSFMGNCKKNLEGQSFYAKGGRPFCKAHAR
uniref:Uncharacterized protein n=1 Tax=Timema monikensis TaxID=170555 RepID=A0A7R9E3M9_9NEOP|nr:unnamed protein product [Timema monikensis]